MSSTTNLTQQRLDILKAKNVPEELFPLVDSTFHVLTERGVMFNGHVYTRGDEITLTMNDVIESINYLGDSFLTKWLTDDAQKAAFGEVRFARGPKPDGFLPYVPGSVSWKLAKRNALNAAYRYNEGTPERDSAVEKVEEYFGEGTVNIGRQIRWSKPTNGAS
ncbi:MAG: hypothetical protein ACTIA6_03465 [Pseudoclavibacter sp.]